MPCVGLLYWSKSAFQQWSWTLRTCCHMWSKCWVQDSVKELRDKWRRKRENECLSAFKLEWCSRLVAWFVSFRSQPWRSCPLGIGGGLIKRNPYIFVQRAQGKLETNCTGRWQIVFIGGIESLSASAKFSQWDTRKTVVLPNWQK